MRLIDVDRIFCRDVRRLGDVCDAALTTNKADSAPNRLYNNTRRGGRSA